MQYHVDACERLGKVSPSLSKEPVAPSKLLGQATLYLAVQSALRPDRPAQALLYDDSAPAGANHHSFRSNSCLAMTNTIYKQ